MLSRDEQVFYLVVSRQTSTSATLGTWKICTRDRELIKSVVVVAKSNDLAAAESALSRARADCIGWE